MVSSSASLEIQYTVPLSIPSSTDGSISSDGTSSEEKEHLKERIAILQDRFEKSEQTVQLHTDIRREIPHYLASEAPPKLQLQVRVCTKVVQILFAAAGVGIVGSATGLGAVFGTKVGSGVGGAVGGFVAGPPGAAAGIEIGGCVGGAVGVMAGAYLGKKAIEKIRLKAKMLAVMDQITTTIVLSNKPRFDRWRAQAIRSEIYPLFKGLLRLHSRDDQDLWCQISFDLPVIPAYIQLPGRERAKPTWECTKLITWIRKHKRAPQPDVHIPKDVTVELSHIYYDYERAEQIHRVALTIIEDLEKTETDDISTKDRLIQGFEAIVDIMSTNRRLLFKHLLEIQDSTFPIDDQLMIITEPSKEKNN